MGLCGFCCVTSLRSPWSFPSFHRPLTEKQAHSQQAPAPESLGPRRLSRPHTTGSHFWQRTDRLGLLPFRGRERSGDCSCPAPTPRTWA